MRRYRWYLLKLPLSNQALFGLMTSEPRTRNTESWFTPTDSSPKSTSFLFSWKTEVVITNVDEFGGTSSEVTHTTSRLHISFVEIGKRTFLRAEDAPRNLRPLLLRMEQIAGFGFSVKPISFEGEIPALVLENVDEAKIVGLKLINVVAGKDLLGRMEFASKSGIEIEELKFLKRMSYKRDHSAYDLTYKGAKGHLAISSNGSARIGGSLTPRILAFLERSLPQYC